MSTKILALLLSFFVLLLVVELIRREKLTFKYAAGWILVSCLALFFSVFDQALFQLAFFFGFELPSNFIFFSLLAVFVFLSLLLTILVCQQDVHNDRIAQKLGILEHDVQEMKKKQPGQGEDRGNKN